MRQFDQSKQTSVSGAKIENALDGWRDEFQQGGFAFNPVRDGVGAAQVVERMLS